MPRNSQSQWAHAPHGDRYHYVDQIEDGRVDVPCGASSFAEDDVTIVSETAIEELAEKCNVCRYLAGELDSTPPIY